MPVLRKKSDSNQIIAGRKGLLVFRELKIAEIPSIVYEFQELSDILERLSKLEDIEKLLSLIIEGE